MAALPRLAEIVPLLYRADWTTLSLSARVHWRDNWALRRQLSQDRLRRLRPRWRPPAQDEAVREPEGERTGRLVIAPGGKFRLESAADSRPLLSLGDGEWCYHVSDGEATRLPAASDPYPRLAELLRPAGLLTRFALVVAGAVSAGDHTGYRLTGTARPGAAGPAAAADRDLEEVILLADADLGILLSYQERARGEQLSLTELAELVHDPAEAGDPALFRPPPGMTVTDARPLFRGSVTLPGLPGQAARAAAGAVSAGLSFAIRHTPRQQAEPATEPMPAPAPAATRWEPAGEDLVNLIYRTGLPPLDVSADVHQWIDARGAMTGLAQLRGALPPAFAGILGAEQVWDTLAGRAPAVGYEVTRLQIALPGRYRIDQLAGGRQEQPQTVACDGGQLRKFYPGAVATGRPAALRHPYASLTDPAWLLGGFTLLAGGETEVAGRRGFRIRAEHRPGAWGPHWHAAPPFSRGVSGAPPAVPGTGRTELVIDAELGIGLRSVFVLDGQPAAAYELRNVTAGTDPAAYRPAIPPGTRTISANPVSELLRDSPVRAAKAAAGLGVAGAAALAGWLQQRPSRPRPPADAEGEDRPHGTG